MRVRQSWCRFGGMFSLLAAAALARGQEAARLKQPDQLPTTVEPAPADPKATAPPADLKAAPAAEKAASECEVCKPWTAKVPVIDKFPPLGLTIIQPDGCGYYSLEDLLRGNCREAPPKYPYPRSGAFAWSFFNADWRYLDDPKNTEHDFFDPLKRIPIGDHWLFTTGGEMRYRYMNEVDSRLSGRDNVYDLYRGRVYGDLWYLDWFRLYVEGIYAESLNNDLPRAVIDANRADFLNLFADLKVWETCAGHPIYFRVGRQELLYGSERLISPLDWANTRRTFQGGKLYYRGDKWDADAFIVQPVVPNVGRLDSVDNNQIFTGAWVTYRPHKGVWLDVWYLNLDNTNPTVTGPNGVKGGQNVSTVGSRYYSNEHPVMWDLEGMVQFGEAANQHILAKAFTTGVGYQVKELPMTPSWWVYYDYASGDPDPSATATRRTFNQLYPFGHYYFGYLDLVGRQNINDINTQTAIFPTKWLTCVAQYHIFRLDSDKDALYNAAGAAIRRDPTGRAGNDVGEELDLLANFHLSVHADLLLGYSHLYAGDFLKATGNGRSPDLFYAQSSFRW